MPVITWIHDAADPLASGELRRLGLPALVVEGEGWTSRFVHADRARGLQTDILVTPLAALDVLPVFAGDHPPLVIVEIDDLTAETRPALVRNLPALSGRIAAVCARGPASRRRARAALGSTVPIHDIPDSAERLEELKAAALRFSVPWSTEALPDLPAGLELWFAEAGDLIDGAEITAVADAWAAPGEGCRTAIAPAETLEWLRQAGAVFDIGLHTPDAVGAALECEPICLAPSGAQAARLRRRRKIERYGAAVAVSAAPADADVGDCDPKAVGAAWRRLLDALAAGRSRAVHRTPAITLFLDLIQDLDLALPLVDELIHRKDARLKIVVSSWLMDRSPRVSAELEARRLTPDVVARPAVLSGAEPSLGDVDALVSVVETSDPAHTRVHALFQRARALGVPTFSLQHGIENIGLTYFGGSDAEIVSDHVLTWFPREHTPSRMPNSLKPRLVHVGRPSQNTGRAVDFDAVFSGFDRLAAVFENLHWDRYDDTYRRRFLDDCSEFAQAFPTTAVLIKPHHAGLWAAKNRGAFPAWTANLVMADPTDPFWEPFTAPSLIQAADLVITTPSTVALDAALARRPVAVVAYGHDLPAFQPLPLLQSAADWIAFGEQAASADTARKRASFVSRNTKAGVAEHDAVAYLLAVAQDRAARRADPVGKWTAA
jgi:hypothetical protein